MSWTLDFFRQWSPYFSLLSVWRLRGYFLRDDGGLLRPGSIIELDMRSPVRTRLRLREVGSDVFTLLEVFKLRVYENITEHIGQCETIVDLGANVGLATLYFAGKYQSARIVGLEPHPATFDLLQSNLKPLIQQGRCTIIHGAIWGKSGILAVTLPGDGEFNAVTVSESGGAGDSSTRAFTMQQIIDQHHLKRVDLLKVDIEGAELELFTGDTSWLDKVGAIAIEFHGDSRARSNFDSVIARHGLQLIDSGNHTILAARDVARNGA
jgi:FkbM family methyltransferase